MNSKNLPVAPADAPGATGESPFESPQAAIALLDGQRRVLEQIVLGVSLVETLSDLLRVIETQSPDMHCAIHRLDDDGLRLWNVAAPSLPNDFALNLHGGSIGPNSHCSGSAAYHKRPIAAPDISQDVAWQGYRDWALQHGLVAAWATPICDSSNRVLGTLSVYFKTKALPTPHQLQLLEMARHIAAIALGKRKEESALLRSESRLAVAQAQAHIGSWELDLPEQKATWSDELYRLLGRDPKLGVVMMPEFLEFVHPGDRHGLGNAFAESVRVGSFTYFEFRSNPAHGALRHFAATSQHFKDEKGTIVRMTGTIQDVTARKLNEASLREKARRLREAQSIGRIGDWRYDLRTGEIKWSDVLYELFERDPHLKPPGFDENMSYYFPEDSARLRALVKRATETGEPFESDLHIRLPNGKEVWHHGIGHAERDETGKIVELFGIAQDITERKQYEARLQASEEQLRALLARLQRVQEDERARLSRQLHDELGQLLTGLKMDIRWIERKLSELPESSAINRIVDRAVSASELTDTTITTVQRIAGELRPGALDQLGLGAALTQYARRFEARSEIPCKVSVSEAGPPLPGLVAEEFFYICTEALTNVARHAQATRVEIFLRTGTHSAALEIIDNGVGISDTRISAANSLGLLGMRERARHCGGTIEITRNDPHGTRVTATIPR